MELCMHLSLYLLQVLQVLQVYCRIHRTSQWITAVALSLTLKCKVMVRLSDGHQIHHLTVGIGTIFRLHSQYHSELVDSSGGHSSKLNPANIGYAKWIVCRGKADNTVRATKALQDVTNQYISSQTVCHNFEKVWSKTCSEEETTSSQATSLKGPVRLCREPQEVDWMRVWWSSETKINHLGSDGRYCVWKEVEEQLSDRLVEGTEIWRW